MEVFKMNKSQLIAAVAEKTGFTKVDAAKAIEAVTASVVDSLKAGDKVSLVGFGTFEAKKRPARIGRNPKTKEEIKIAASVAPSFKAGRAFKSALN